MNEKLTITHIVYTLVSMSCLQYFIIFELYRISIKNSLKKIIFRTGKLPIQIEMTKN